MHLTANTTPTNNETRDKLDMLLNPDKATQYYMDKKKTMDDIRNAK